MDIAKTKPRAGDEVVYVFCCISNSCCRDCYWLQVIDAVTICCHSNGVVYSSDVTIKRIKSFHDYLLQICFDCLHSVLRLMTPD